MELRLDHNKLETARDLGSDKLPYLRVLRLGHNAIRSLSGLSESSSLCVLDIQFNRWVTRTLASRVKGFR